MSHTSNDLKGNLDIIHDESIRLARLGIPYLFIHCYEGQPVVIVDESTMARIQASQVKGSFVSQDSQNRWTASYYSRDGQYHTAAKLTEIIAYRRVLGYPTGRKRYNTRFAHAPEIVRKKKTKRNY